MKHSKRTWLTMAVLLPLLGGCTQPAATCQHPVKPSVVIEPAGLFAWIESTWPNLSTSPEDAKITQTPL